MGAAQSGLKGRTVQAACLGRPRPPSHPGQGGELCPHLVLEPRGSGARETNAPPCFCPTPWPRPPRPKAPGRRGHDLHPDPSPFSWAGRSGLGSSVWGARPPGWQLHYSVRSPQIADIRARHTEGLCPQDTKQSLGAGRRPLASPPPPPAGLWGHQGWRREGRWRPEEPACPP